MSEIIHVEEVVVDPPVAPRAEELLQEFKARRADLPDRDEESSPKRREALFQLDQSLMTNIRLLSDPLAILRDAESRIRSLREIPLVMADPKVKRLISWLEREGVAPDWSRRALFTETGVAELIERQVATFEEKRVAANEQLAAAVREADRFLSVLESAA